VSNFLRPMRTFFSQLGASLPGANPDKYGQLNIKRAASTYDEAYLVVRNESGTLVFDRVILKAYGDTLYLLEVKEGGSSVDTGVTVLDFDASDFTVSESPEGEINLGLAYGTSAGTPAEGDHLHDSTYVNVTGDTMTGPLVVDTDTTPALHVLSDAASPFIVEDADGTNRIVFNGSSNQLSVQNAVDFAVYSDAASTLKFSIDGATGDTTIAGALLVNVDSVTALEAQGDDDGIFAVTNSAGSARLVVDTVNNSGAGYVNLANSAGLVIYSDNFSTKKFEVGGATGDTMIVGALNHDGSTVGFFGVTPATRPTTYSVTNLVTDRSYDANATTTAELADVLGTLIADLRTMGLVT
jgi:hypothetical protein